MKLLHSKARKSSRFAEINHQLSLIHLLFLIIIGSTGAFDDNNLELFFVRTLMSTIFFLVRYILMQKFALNLK